MKQVQVLVIVVGLFLSSVTSLSAEKWLKRQVRKMKSQMGNYGGQINQTEQIVIDNINSINQNNQKIENLQSDVNANTGLIDSNQNRTVTNENAINKLVLTNDMWFNAIGTSVVSSSNSWKTLTYDTLRGNNSMNIATGKFVAPYSGDWQFFFQGMDASSAGVSGEMRLMKNNVAMSSAASDNEGASHTIFGTVTLELAAGDEVWIEIYRHIKSGTTWPSTHFTGTCLRMT